MSADVVINHQKNFGREEFSLREINRAVRKCRERYGFERHSPCISGGG